MRNSRRTRFRYPYCGRFRYLLAANRLTAPAWQDGPGYGYRNLVRTARPFFQCRTPTLIPTQLPTPEANMARFSPRHYLFGSFTAGTAGDAGLALLRIFAGLALALAHGMGKIPPQEGFIGWIASWGFPAPGMFAWFSGLAEFAGGVLLALGLLTRPVALLIVLNFVVAQVWGHAGDPFGDRELALLFQFIALQFLVVGAGRYSADWLIGRGGRGAVDADRRAP
jgi:putative oxidoreductase